MRVFEVTVMRGRVAQPKQYESSTAEVSARLTVEETEDWEAAARCTLRRCRDLVFETLGLTVPVEERVEEVAQATPAKPADEVPAEEMTRGQKAAATRKANAAKKAADEAVAKANAANVAAREEEGEEVQVEQTALDAADDEIDLGLPAEEPEEPATVADCQLAASAAVGRNKAVNMPKIKAWLGEVGADKFVAKIPEDKRRAFVTFAEALGTE